MTRKQRIAQDRAQMVERALIHAGYLTGKETAEEKRAIDFGEQAGGLLTDLLHLWARYGKEFESEFTAGELAREINTIWMRIAQEATRNFVDEKLYP